MVHTVLCRSRPELSEGGKISQCCQGEDSFLREAEVCAVQGFVSTHTSHPETHTGMSTQSQPHRGSELRHTYMHA